MHSACKKKKKKPAAALLLLDMTLGLAVYTDTLLYPLRAAAGGQLIREPQHPEGGSTGGILCAPSWKQQGKELASWNGWLLILFFVMII